MFGLPASILALVLILGAFVALGVFRRHWLMATVMAFYPATLAYEHLPLFAPKTNGAAMLTFIVLFAVCWIAIERHIGAEWSGGFPKTVALAIAALAQVIALWVFIVPAFGTLLALAPAIAGLAAHLGEGGLLLIPIALLLVRLA